MTRRLMTVLAFLLTPCGLLAINAGTQYGSRLQGEGRQLVTDTRLGLPDSPLFTHHKEENYGSGDAAVDSGKNVVIVKSNEVHWLSWSSLLVVGGIGAITVSLKALIRLHKSEERPQDQASR